MQRRDWTLLAIAAAEGSPLTPVQLQKSLFLLGRGVPQAVGAEFYQFEPYDYGPFDAAVYRDAEALAAEHLIEIERPLGLRYSVYRSTPEGQGLAVGLRQRAPTRAVDYLSTLVRWTRSLTFAQLVRAVYAAYPEFRVRSVFSG
jgi:hypothetical protein